MQIIVTLDLPGETKRPSDFVLAACIREVADRISDGVAAGDFRGLDGERVGQFGIQEQ